MKWKCALCMWVHYTDVERDHQTPHQIKPAKTIINGTALCYNHLDDWDQDGALRRTAGRIVARSATDDDDHIDMQYVQSLGKKLDPAAADFVESVYAQAIAYVSAYGKQFHRPFPGSIVLNPQDAQAVADEAQQRDTRNGQPRPRVTIRPGLCGTLFGVKLWADDRQPVGSVGATTYV